MVAALYLIAALLGVLGVALLRSAQRSFNRGRNAAVRDAYMSGVIDGLEAANQRWTASK